MPERMSNRSSSAVSEISLPLGASTIVSVRSGKP
jgi:hypothetical protein